MAAPQPSNMDAYIQPDNPVTKEPIEKKAAAQNHSKETSRTARAVPSEHAGEGTFSSLGRGVRGGGGPADATEARNTSRGSTDGRAQDQDQNRNQNQNENVDAEQMATLGEGEVAHAVERKSGMQKAPGDAEVKIDDFASDLDRKKAEQAGARQQIKQDRRTGVDVDGGAGERAAGTEDNTCV